MGLFRNRVCLLFGGTGAIGYSIAERFHLQGAKLAIVGRCLEKLRREFERFDNQERIHLIETPTLSSSEIEAAVEQVRSRFGVLHHLVHSMGIGTPANLLDVTEAQFDQMMHVNVKSAFLACRYAVPLMLEGSGGTIVVISSLASIKVAPNMLPYATSKAALQGLVQSIAIDYAPNIRINAISPGHIQTPMVDTIFTQEEQDEIASGYPMNRLGKVEEVADAVLFLSSEQSSWMTGQNIVLDGGRSICY